MQSLDKNEGINLQLLKPKESERLNFKCSNFLAPKLLFKTKSKHFHEMQNMLNNIFFTQWTKCNVKKSKGGNLFANSQEN